MSISDDSNDSGVYQQTHFDEPLSGYLLRRVLSTLLSYFSIIENGPFAYEMKDKVPPIMREYNSPQNWKSWNAVNPPTKQNYSNKVVQAIIDVTKEFLVFPEPSIREIVKELQVTLSPKMIAVDWTIYLYLLEHDLGILKKEDFKLEENYIEWKNNELESIRHLINGGSSEGEVNGNHYATTGYSIAKLKIINARGIHKKAEMSGIFSVIHFQDLYSVSKTINALDFNPRFDHDLSFLLRNNCTTDDKPVIVISLWCKKKGNRSDSFLGYIRLTVSDLTKCSNGAPKYFELQKRSTRSNVSGEVCISVRRVSEEVPLSDLYAEIMTCIPFCYEACLRDLIEIWCIKQSTAEEVDIEKCYGKELIDTLTVAWNVPPFIKSSIAMKVMCNLYAKKKISLNFLRKGSFDRCITYIGSDNIILPEKIKKSISTNVEKLYIHLQERLIDVFFTEINSSKAKEITEIVEALSLIQSTNDRKYKEGIEELLEASIKKYLDHINVIIFSESGDTYVKVTKFVNTLRSFLSSCMFHLDKPLGWGFKFPEISVECLMSELEVVLSKKKYHLSENTDSTFKAYNAVKDLINLCKTIDPDAGNKIALRDYFYEGVVEWLDKASSSIKEWVINSIKVDVFHPISSESYHSTSIIDMFSCFSVHLNFIKSLDWPNKDDEQHFNERLHANILDTIGIYISKAIEIIRAELSKPGGEPVLKTLKEMEKSINHEPKMKLPSVLYLGDASSEVRVTNTICTLVNNINEISSKLETLLDLKKTIVKVEGNSPLVYESRCGAVPESITLRSQRLIKNSFVPIMIKIGTLHSASIKPPCSMPLCVKIDYSGSEVLTTRPIIPKIRAAYNEVAWINAAKGLESETTVNNSKNRSISSKLVVSIIKKVHENGTIDYTEEVISTELVDIDWFLAQEEEVVVPMPSCGCLNIKIVPVERGQRLPILSTMVHWTVDSALKKVEYYIAHEIAKTFRQHIKTSTHKFKNTGKEYINKMINTIDMLEGNKKVLSESLNSMLPRLELNEEIVAKVMSSTMSFLNTNLERIVSDCPLKISLKIIREIWEQVMLASESLVVPLDVESRKERPCWGQDRIRFMEIALQLLYIFFECGGEGLSKNELKSPRYTRLCKILKHYFDQRKGLYAQEVATLGESVDQSEEYGEQWLPAYWTMQIIKVHGEVDYVNSYLKECADSYKLQYDSLIYNGNGFCSTEEETSGIDNECSIEVVREGY